MKKRIDHHCHCRQAAPTCCPLDLPWPYACMMMHAVVLAALQQQWGRLRRAELAAHASPQTFCLNPLVSLSNETTHLQTGSMMFW
jgi:hypothetical protein